MREISICIPMNDIAEKRIFNEQDSRRIVLLRKNSALVPSDSEILTLREENLIQSVPIQMKCLKSFPISGTIHGTWRSNHRM